MVREKYITFTQTGVRIVIHDPEDWPLIDEFGIDISPATYTLAAMTEVSEHCLILLTLI